MTVKAKADAIDRFVRTLKSGGLYDDIGSAAIMAGWTNLAGALTPLKGSTPTNNGFLDANLDAGIGLKGDGSSKYLDSNRAGNADGQNDRHFSVYASAATSSGTAYIGEPSAYTLLYSSVSPADLIGRLSSKTYTTASDDETITGFLGGNRSDASTQELRAGGSTVSGSVASTGSGSNNTIVYSYNTTATPSDAILSWYSIGSATDLAVLDSAVSTLMADLRAIDEAGFEPETVNYLRAVEAAEGSFLESGVKKAINRFIVGCKKDGIWDAIKASCILCGARTIAGALVPLAGTAPTAYNFVSANYNRETGLIGVPASSTYIDTNRANDADGQDDVHVAAYVTASANNASYVIGANAGGSNNTLAGYDFWCRSLTGQGPANAAGAGLNAVSRSSSASFTYVDAGGAPQTSAKASATQSTVNNVFVFAANVAGSPANITNARIAFYSIGSAISDLSLLDTRVTNLVTEIAAAIQ